MSLMFPGCSLYAISWLGTQKVETHTMLSMASEWLTPLSCSGSQADCRSDAGPPLAPLVGSVQQCNAPRLLPVMRQLPSRCTACSHSAQQCSQFPRCCLAPVSGAPTALQRCTLCNTAAQNASVISARKPASSTHADYSAKLARHNNRLPSQLCWRAYQAGGAGGAAGRACGRRHIPGAQLAITAQRRQQPRRGCCRCQRHHLPAVPWCARGHITCKHVPQPCLLRN